MAWLYLTVYDISKPSRNKTTLVDVDSVSDFFEESLRDPNDDDVVHEFTVVAFKRATRAVRVKETVQQIVDMLEDVRFPHSHKS